MSTSGALWDIFVGVLLDTLTTLSQTGNGVVVMDTSAQVAMMLLGTSTLCTACENAAAHAGLFEEQLVTFGSKCRSRCRSSSEDVGGSLLWHFLLPCQGCTCRERLEPIGLS